jgi:hypothetical protein
MFVERKVLYSALFTNLVGWHASAVSFPQSDVILAQLACSLSDIMFYLHSGITNLSLYIHCLNCTYKLVTFISPIILEILERSTLLSLKYIERLGLLR